MGEGCAVSNARGMGVLGPSASFFLAGPGPLPWIWTRVLLRPCKSDRLTCPSHPTHTYVNPSVPFSWWRGKSRSGFSRGLPSLSPTSTPSTPVLGLLSLESPLMLSPLLGMPLTPLSAGPCQSYASHLSSSLHQEAPDFPAGAVSPTKRSVHVPFSDTVFISLLSPSPGRGDTRCSPLEARIWDLGNVENWNFLSFALCFWEAGSGRDDFVSP